MSLERHGSTPIQFRVAGMMTKLQERTHGMRRLCDAVNAALRSAPDAVTRLARFRDILVLVTVDDVPLPPAADQLTQDGRARLHMQTVGPRELASDLFPDFVFGGWWHIGLHDYDTFARAMEARAAAAPARSAQAFWIGNPEMSPSRVRLVEMSRERPSRIDARPIVWQHTKGNVTEATGERAATDRWVTLQRHSDWRYLIDLRGTGWSGRLKLLPYANRPLLVQERPHWDWASSRLRPWEHYVPVAADLDDPAAGLLPALDWLDADPDRAKRMADAASRLAQSLGFGAAVEQAVNLTLRKLDALLPPPPPPPPPASPSPPSSPYLRSMPPALCSRGEPPSRVPSPQPRRRRSFGDRLQSAAAPQRKSEQSLQGSSVGTTPAGLPEPLASSCGAGEASGSADAGLAGSIGAGAMDVADAESFPGTACDHARQARASQARAEQEVAAAAKGVAAATSVPTVYLVEGVPVAVHPISNSLPDALFVPHVPHKSHSFATCIPGNKSTYLFHEEATYLEHYRRAARPPSHSACAASLSVERGCEARVRGKGFAPCEV